MAQPPLPLQVFLPLQPMSLVLQPPWPLHAFLFLQECAWDNVVLVSPPQLPVARPAWPAGWPVLATVTVEAPAELFANLSRAARSRYGFQIDPRHFAVLGRCSTCSA